VRNDGRRESSQENERRRPSRRLATERFLRLDGIDSASRADSVRNVRLPNDRTPIDQSGRIRRRSNAYVYARLRRRSHSTIVSSIQSSAADADPVERIDHGIDPGPDPDFGIDHHDVENNKTGNAFSFSETKSTRMRQERKNR